jgi:hypothetical protein
LVFARIIVVSFRDLTTRQACRPHIGGAMRLRLYVFALDAFDNALNHFR